MENVFLGKPPANVEAWMRAHTQPAGYADTRFTLQGGTVESYDIVGPLAFQWFIDHGFVTIIEEEPWIKTVLSVDIGNTVTGIESYTFDTHSFIKTCPVENVITPTRDFYIGDNAFAETNLTSATLNDGLTSIGDNAFHLTKLATITIPSTVESIGANAFSDCMSLTSLHFPEKTCAQVQAMSNFPWGVGFNPSDEYTFNVDFVCSDGTVTVQGTNPWA